MFLLLNLACTPDVKDPVDTGPVETDTDTDTDSDTDTDTDSDTDTDTDVGDADADGYSSDVDCDDTDAAIHPDATESCDAVDQDCDGQVDEGFGSVAFLADTIVGGMPSTGGTWYGYDGEDNLVLLGPDLDEDGVIESYRRYEWSDGHLTAEEQSYDGVTPGYRMDYTYDGDFVAEARADTDGDGTTDWAYGYWYVDGLYAGYWFDDGYDGVYETEQHFEYDENGDPSRYWEDNGDGNVDYELLYTYTDGVLVSYVADADGDGTFETTATYVYEGARLVEEWVAGGSSPSRRTYTYVDADDHYDSIDLDLGDDGDVDWRYGYGWADDLVVSQTYDEFGDGVGVLEYTFTYDERGLTEYATIALDGTYTSFTEYEWDGDRQTAYRLDVNADGTWDIEYLYDARGQTVYESVDGAGDGAIDQIRTMETDDRLRRLGATTDTLGDGVLEAEQVIRGEYTCGSM